MRKYLVCLLIVSLITVPAFARSTPWKGSLSVSEETVIPKGRTVRAYPGTRILFSSSQGKINVRGKLLASGEENNPVVFVIPNFASTANAVSIHDKTVLKMNAHTKELEIYPYDVETEEIIDELRAFRYQYAFVWTVLMGVCFYLVLNKSTYW
jgi:hypothetical protein